MLSSTRSLVRQPRPFSKSVHQALCDECSLLWNSVLLLDRPAHHFPVIPDSRRQMLLSLHTMGPVLLCLFSLSSPNSVENIFLTRLHIIHLSALLATQALHFTKDIHHIQVKYLSITFIGLAQGLWIEYKNTSQFTQDYKTYFIPGWCEFKLDRGFGSDHHGQPLDTNATPGVKFNLFPGGGVSKFSNTL